ncbi:MAG: hypothetical protein SF123_09650 [Chloroflexota bacterium]|nr:hypothetical protein [Chloroflexota bacterium]
MGDDQITQQVLTLLLTGGLVVGRWLIGKYLPRVASALASALSAERTQEMEAVAEKKVAIVKEDVTSEVLSISRALSQMDEDWRRRLDALKEEHRAEIDQLRREYSTQIENLTERLRLQGEQVVTLKKRTRSALQKRNAARAQADHWQAEAERWKAEAEKSERERAELLEQIAKLRKELELLKTQVAALERGDHA